MTASRDSAAAAAGLPFAVALAAGLALAAPCAEGQEPVGEPLQLLPPGAGEMDDRPPDRRIVVEPQDVAGAGLLGPEEGGFGPTAWGGARRHEVTALLEGLPVAAPSTVMSDLTRRLLLTAARPPVGPAVEPSLVGLRARRLRELGRADDLLALLRAAPALRRDGWAARSLVEALLLAGRTPEACAELDTLLPAHQGRFWGQAVTYCSAVAGDRPAARQYLDLLREGNAAEPVFIMLVEALIDDEPAALPRGAWPRGQAPEPLMMAAFTSARLPVPGADLIRDPGRLAAVAASPFNAVETRLDAGERAAAGGAMQPGDLAALYAAVPLAAMSPTDLLDHVLEMAGPMARAHLVQAADRAGAPRPYYRLYETALSLSRAEGAPLAVILALLDPLAVAPEGAAIAADAARAYYAAGDLERAWAWHEVAARAGERRALARLWPLAVLAGALDDHSGARGPVAYARNLSEWIGAEAAVSGEAGFYSAAMALAAFNALGEPVDPDVWRSIRIDDARETASLPSAGIWWRLPAAARDGETGMVVLMSLVAIGERGPARISPVLLERVLSAMVASGLEEDARRLAREAIWATQL